MKRICFLLILFCLALHSLAQTVIDPKGTKVVLDSSKWKISGNDIYNKNTGNIGIGVTSPAAQLHTSGSVRLQGIGTNTINTNIVTTDAIGNVTTRALSSLLSGSAITSLNGITASTQTFATGTSGTDFNIVSSGSSHTFNFPTASAGNRGLLSSAGFTTFNNKIGTVTATTLAAVTTAGTTATINNTVAYWNANQLQGSNIANTTPANGQVLTYNNSTSRWEPAAAAPVTTSNTLSNTTNTITSTVNGIIATAPAVNTVANNAATNTLTTTVNGVAATGVSIINSNALIQNGTNQLVSIVNGVTATALTTNITGDVTGNLGASVVSKINGSPLGTTTGAGSGQILAWNGTAWAPANAAPAITTNTLSLSGNTLTSTVNAVAATSSTVATVSNNSSANNLSTTVNGVAGTAVSIINSISNNSSTNSLTTTVNGISGTAVNLINSNALNLSSGSLTSVVNGVTSAAANVLATANSGLTATSGNVQLGGALTQATTLTTTATNTLALPGLQNGISTDSLIVIGTGTGGVIRKVVNPASFPQILVDARRTATYSTAATYATIIYNTAAINIGTAYNTSTGVFTAPATGLYQIIANNGYNLNAIGISQISNRIIVNSTVDLENYTSFNTGLGGNANYTLNAGTIISIAAGQTVTIACGGASGTITPLFGTGQHVMKIIRLQ